MQKTTGDKWSPLDTSDPFVQAVLAKAAKIRWMAWVKDLTAEGSGWDDITDDIIGKVATQREESFEGGITANTASLVVRNTDGRWSINQATSPYTNLKKGLEIKIELAYWVSGAWSNIRLFTGFLSKLPSMGSADYRATVYCEDNMKNLLSKVLDRGFMKKDHYLCKPTDKPHSLMHFMVETLGGETNADLMDVSDVTSGNARYRVNWWMFKVGDRLEEHLNQACNAVDGVLFYDEFGVLQFIPRSVLAVHGLFNSTTQDTLDVSDFKTIEPEYIDPEFNKYIAKSENRELWPDRISVCRWEGRIPGDQALEKNPAVHVWGKPPVNAAGQFVDDEGYVLAENPWRMSFDDPVWDVSSLAELQDASYRNGYENTEDFNVAENDPLEFVDAVYSASIDQDPDDPTVWYPINATYVECRIKNYDNVGYGTDENPIVVDIFGKPLRSINPLQASYYNGLEPQREREVDHNMVYSSTWLGQLAVYMVEKQHGEELTGNTEFLTYEGKAYPYYQIGDRVKVQEAVLGIDQDYIIRSITLSGFENLDFRMELVKARTATLTYPPVSGVLEGAGPAIDLEPETKKDRVAPGEIEAFAVAPAKGRAITIDFDPPATDGDGEPLEDLDHYDIYISPSTPVETATPTIVALSTHVKWDDWEQGSAQYGQTVYAAAQAVDRSGNKGPLTDAQSAIFEKISTIDVDELSATKITAGTIGAHIIYLGNTTFVLDGGNKCIWVYDNQATPCLRVKLGKVGAGETDYGTEMYDADGNLRAKLTDAGLRILDSEGKDIIDAAGIFQGFKDSVTYTGTLAGGGSANIDTGVDKTEPAPLVFGYAKRNDAGFWYQILRASSEMYWRLDPGATNWEIYVKNDLALQAQDYKFWQMNKTA